MSRGLWVCMYYTQERGKDLGSCKSTPSWEVVNSAGMERDEKMSGDTDFPDPVPTAAWRVRQSLFDRGWLSKTRCQQAVCILGREVRPVIIGSHGRQSLTTWLDSYTLNGQSDHGT